MEIEEPTKKAAEEVEWKKNPPHLDGVADMSALIYLEGPNVLHNLDCRYKKNEIYTSISKVLIAINPFQNTVDYSGRLISIYRQEASKRKQTLPPHVFSVSQSAYFNLIKYKTNQSLIVCGESGSGKTESAKHLMRYLAYTPESEKKGGISIEDQVLDANPILESFGNAKTCLNWNSSRFGKFTKIVFAAPQQDRIVGSFIETYLLEKSRVVHQDPDERNYHVFYYVTTPGALEEEQWNQWKLTTADQFHYSMQGNAIAVKEISDIERYKELRHALNTLKFTPEEQVEILQIVAALLHLGNIPFTANDKDLAEITTPEAKAELETAANLFQVPAPGLLKRLTTATLKVAGSAITKTLSLYDAQINRDSVAKALYHGLFEWVVSKINTVLFEEDARKPDLKWIGILDVFGFESFEHNSFEQFCINFANERLQQYFNLNIIKSEQDLYRSESILWTPIKVSDNQDVIDLIDGKQRGILILLDNACKMPKGDAAVFIRNLFQMNKYHPRMREVKRVRNSRTSEVEDINGFSILHYAGKVVYDALEFLTKNMDQSQQDTITLFCDSKGSVTSALLEDEEMRAEKAERKKQEEAKAKAAVAASAAPAGRAKSALFSQFEKPGAGRGRGLPAKAASAAPSGGRKPETSFKSVGNYFSAQLEKLMTTLYQTTPFFVRCIKPNSLKKPNNFDWNYARPQLECGGIIEALRILKCGYPSRCSYDDIFSRYGQIMKPIPPNLNKRDFCEAILRNAGETLDRAEFQLGLSKVFFRPGKGAFLEELLETGGDLSADVVARIKLFLLNKRLSRGRGAIRVHIIFKLRLRQMRALQAVWKLFRMTRVIAATMLLRLRKVRSRLAAQALQAHIEAYIGEKKQQQWKNIALTIENFYMHNRFRKRIKRELNVRIEKKRELLAAEERRRREREEAERKEADARAIADQAKRAQREAEAKARAEKERIENEARERERLVREQREKEKREQERKELEYQEALLRAKEAEKKLKEEREKAEAELKAQLEDKKGETERLTKELQDKSLALDLREFELNEREKKIKEAGEQKSKETTDPMAQLVKRGTTFFRHEGKIEEANTVQVTVNDEGVLKWIESDTVNEAGENPQGEIKLKNIVQIKAGTRPNGEDQGKDVNLFLTIESKTDDGKADTLELQAGTAEMRDKWVTALRYCWRNMKDLDSITRPPRDLARGNILAAMLTDELHELKERYKKVRAKLADKEKDLSAAPVARPAGSDAAANAVVSSSGQLVVGGEVIDAKAVQTYKDQLDHLKKKNIKLTQLLQKEQKKRKSSEASAPQAPLTALLEEKKKILILEEKNQHLAEENKRLRDRIGLLEEEAEQQRALKLSDQGRMRDENLIAEIERKHREAKDGAEKAESAVMEAESAVRKRQDVIRNAMKVLAERKNALANTEQTMSVLGITGRDPESLEDSTARRLAELYRTQRKEQQEAEAVLLKEYAAMVEEAEALNQKNEDLARKTFQKEKTEQLVKQVAVKKPSAVLSKKGGAGVGAGAAGGAGGGVPGEKDDGCVIS